MDIPRAVKVVNAQLGLNIPNNAKKTHPPETIIELLKGFDAINQRYSDHRPAQARRSEAIKDAASDLFIRLGPALWPDIDESAEVPSWLKPPSGDLGKQYLSRRYYSNDIDREFLADRFHALVCVKVGQYHGNGKRERKSRQPSGIEEDSEVEEAGNPGYNDISFYQNIPEDEFDNIPYHSTAGTPEAQREDSELRSTGQQQMSPHTGPATPLFHGEGPMGDTPSKLAKAGLYQPVEQQRKSDKPACNRLGDNFTVDELDSPRVSIRSSSAYEPSQSPPGYIGRDDQPLSNIPQSTKRALSDQARGRKSKKNKISSNVHTVKPTLLVVLKLTRGKDAMDRAMTMPPRQANVLVPSTGVDENPAGHSATRRRYFEDVATDYETRDEQHHIQPTMPNQDPANNDSEAATDITCGSNDRTTACRASGSTVHMDDHTRPSIFTQQQPLTTQQEQDFERLAELLERCSRGEVHGILKQLMVRSLKEHTPEEVESNILLPVLRQTLDQVLSTTAGIDPHSMASDVQERFTSQKVCLCQHHCMPVDNSIDHLRVRPPEAIVPLSDVGTSQNSSSQSVKQADTIPVQTTIGDRNLVDTTPCLGEMSEAAREATLKIQQSCETKSGSEAHDAALNDTNATHTMGYADQISVFDYDRLVENINVTVYIDRNDGLDPKELGAIGVIGIRSGNAFFDNLQYELGWQLESNEEFSKAIITEADGLVTKRPQTNLRLRNNSRIERSWHMWLSGLRKSYEETGINPEMHLTARVLVTRKKDSK